LQAAARRKGVRLDLPDHDPDLELLAELARLPAPGHYRPGAEAGALRYYYPVIISTFWTRQKYEKK
jgi:hypothetical protein